MLIHSLIGFLQSLTSVDTFPNSRIIISKIEHITFFPTLFSNSQPAQLTSNPCSQSSKPNLDP